MNNNEKNLIHNMYKTLPTFTKEGSIEKFWDKYGYLISDAGFMAYEYDITNKNMNMVPEMFLFFKELDFDLSKDEGIHSIIQNIRNGFTPTELKDLQGTILEFDEPNIDKANGFFMRLQDFASKNQHKQRMFIDTFLKQIPNITDDTRKYVSKSMIDNMLTKCFWFGSFLARQDNSIRLAINETNMEEMYKTLEHFNWEGPISRVKDLFNELFQSEFNIDLMQVELEETIRDRIGFEIKPKKDVSDWNTLYDYLEQRDLVNKDKIEELKKLRHIGMINHIKISFDLSGFVNCKIYFVGSLPPKGVTIKTIV